MNDQPPANRQQFAYSRVDERCGTGALRPRLPLILTHRDQALAVIGLLDTGADVNVLPYAIGLQLGARWDEQVVVPGLSGNLGHYEARGLILSAQVGHFPPSKLAFAWTRAEHVPLILGQVNFFLEYEVCFFARVCSSRCSHDKDKDQNRVNGGPMG